VTSRSANVLTRAAWRALAQARAGAPEARRKDLDELLARLAAKQDINP